jgi:predicted DNA-binding transcriptional regulator YafY
MSFSKAMDLVRLAQMAAAKRRGVSLADIIETFGVSHRTAQRMTHALEASFANVVSDDGPDLRRRWRITGAHDLARLRPRQETAIEALEIAMRGARDEGRLRHARALEETLDWITASLDTRASLRAESDVEAVLSSIGHVARPGPKVALKPGILDEIIEALRGPFRLQITYREPTAPARIIEPHGILLGPRTYLVARQPSYGPKLINFRVDRIEAATCLDESFELEAGFTIERYAARAFGSHQTEGQYQEVVWRFLPEAAERAAGFRFHPDQVLEWKSDGSLIVRFHAAGWLEMAWHLYQWGDKVEVLAPEGLRDYVHPWRRSDLDGMP